MKAFLSAVALSAAIAAVPAAAQTARDQLVRASFADREPAVALRRVNAVLAGEGKGANASEAALLRCTAMAYRAKLTGSRGDALAARRQFEALVAREPGNAEAQIGLGAWHVGAVNRLGGLVARAALGASRRAGMAAIDRAVALGGERAQFAGLAALLRLQLDPADPRGRALAEQATRAATPTAIDRLMRKAAGQVLAAVRGGDRAAVRAAASRLLPLGQIAGLD